jgi:hypothetical protein
MSLGEFIPSSNTKLLLHLNGNSTDSSGNNNNGTDTNITYSQANGKFGQGAWWNGSNSRMYISSFTQVGGNATWSWWMKRAGSGSRSNSWIIGSWETQLDLLVYVLASDSKLTVQICGSSGFATPSALTNGVWYNFTVVRNGTSAYLYQNGKLVNSISGLTLRSDVGQQIRLGCNNTNDVDAYNGAIDEFIKENYAWTPQQVAKYYTMTKGRFGII